MAYAALGSNLKEVIAVGEKSQIWKRSKITEHARSLQTALLASTGNAEKKQALDAFTKFYIEVTSKLEQKGEAAADDAFVEAQDLLDEAMAQFDDANSQPKTQQRSKSGEEADETLTTCQKPLNEDDKERAKMVHFSDIAGMDEVKDQMRAFFIYPMRYSGMFKKSGNVLLYGPAGTGKTFFAKAAAAELKNVAFYAPTPDALLGKFEGETEKNMKKVFTCASYFLDVHPEFKKAIIFFDEFDALAAKRTGEDRSSVRKVTTLLQLMDGINSDKRISVLAATNYPSTLDEAILSRMNRRILIDLPDRASREFIIRSRLAANYNWPFESYMKIDVNNMRTTGGCYMANIRAFAACEDTEELKQMGFDPVKQLRKSQIQVDTGSTSGLFRATTKYRYTVSVNAEFIDDFVDLTGPRNDQETKDIVKRADDNEYAPNAIARFGYSSRDLDKIMDLVIASVALRSVTPHRDEAGNELPIKMREVKVSGASETYYVYDVKANDTNAECARDFEVTDIIEEKPCHKVVPTKGKDKLKVLQDIPSKSADRALTFDVRPSDFLEALTKHSSSVDEARYIDLKTKGESSS